MTERSLSVLLHGAAKSGKSTLASTSPAPVLYIDIEGGTEFFTRPLTHWSPRTQEPPEPDGTWEICVVSVLDWEDAVQALAWVKSGKHPFNSIVIDSISELQQKLVEKVSGRGQTQTPQWGEIFRTFSGMLRDYRDLKKHPIKPIKSVVWVAMTKQGDDGKWRPWLNGQAATVVPYLPDVLGWTEIVTWSDPETQVQSTAYRLIIGANPVAETGERVGGRLPAWLDNTSIPQMLEYIQKD